MSHREQLKKLRSVRLSEHTDSLLEGEAARLGKSASELIRETLERAFPDTQTASECFLEAAQKPPARRVSSPEREAFRKAWLSRHCHDCNP
jgi:hypothetical protein